AASAVIAYGDVERIPLLISYGWNVNTPLKIELWNVARRPLEYWFEKGSYVSAETSELKRLACIHQLLDQPNIEIDFLWAVPSGEYFEENKASDLLHKAITQGWETVVKRLLNPPFSVSANTISDARPRCSALQRAIETGQESMVALLLAHHADPNGDLS